MRYSFHVMLFSLEYHFEFEINAIKIIICSANTMKSSNILRRDFMEF